MYMSDRHEPEACNNSPGLGIEASHTWSQSSCCRMLYTCAHPARANIVTSYTDIQVGGVVRGQRRAFSNSLPTYSSPSDVVEDDSPL